MKKFWMRLVGTISLLFLVFMMSCIKQLGNHPPVIEAIILNPSDVITPGSDIAISAMVTDRDGDPLEYYWESEGGVIDQPGHASAIWVLSTQAEPLSYESITLTISDGLESVKSTKTIQVSEGHIMAGYTYFEGTSIPVPGVEVFMGKFSAISDETGYYFIEHLREGNTIVSAVKEGFELFESVVYVDFPKSTYNIELKSPTQTMELSGIIKTVDNITYAGLKVALLNPDDSESDLIGFTDEKGFYSIPNIPLGSRSLLVRNVTGNNHFLNDSAVYQVHLDNTSLAYDARIKIKRTIISDNYLSEKDKWEFDGVATDGFYLLGKGQRLSLKDFISIPPDAEDAMLYLNSYVIGGCDLVGRLPSHRIWISNMEQEYLGGISWGGEGSNFPAEVSWMPSKSPTFIYIYGKPFKIRLEIFEENTCVPNPLWRIYQIEFSYYY